MTSPDGVGKAADKDLHTRLVDWQGDAAEAFRSDGPGIAMDILGAVAVIAGAVAAPATGGTSVVATAAFRWALVEAGAGLAGSAIEAAPSVGGGNTVEVLQSMDRSVAELRQSMVDAETKLGDALRSDLGVAQGNLDDLLPGRPNVIADPHGNLTEFTMPPEFPPPTATRTGGP